MILGNKKNKLDIDSLNKAIRVTCKILNVLFIFILLVLIIAIQKINEAYEIFKIVTILLNIISPLFIGFFISWFLEPFICRLQKMKIGRKLSIVIVFVLFCFFFFFIIYLFVPSFMKQLDEMIRVVPSLIESVDGLIKGLFTNLERIYKVDLTELRSELYDSISRFSESFTVGLSKTIIGIVIAFFNMSINFFVGLIIAFYISFDFNNIRRNMINVLPNKYRGDILELTDRIDNNLKQFVLGTFFDMVILFVVQSFMFFIIGIDAPLVFGFICAITNIIPYIGPYIGGIPAVLMAFTMDTKTGLLAIVVVVLAQMLESYILNPIIMSRSVKLHPVTIIVGLLIFGYFFSIPGMILSTPIISCIKVIFNFLETKLELYDRMNL